MNRSHPAPTPRHRGYTLIEILLTLGGMAVLLAAAGPAVHNSVRHLRASATGAEEGQFIAQATILFRRSVHRSAVAEAGPGGLTLSDGRCEVDGGTIRFGTGEGNASWSLSIPPALQCAFRVEQDDGPPRAVLDIHEEARLRARIVACPK